MIRPFLLLPLTAAVMLAQTYPLEAIVAAARANSPALKDLLATNFPNLKGLNHRSARMRQPVPGRLHFCSSTRRSPMGIGQRRAD